MRLKNTHNNNMEELSVTDLLDLSEKELVVLKGIHVDLPVWRISNILDLDEKQVDAIVHGLMEKGYIVKSGFWIFERIHLTEKGLETLRFYGAGKIIGTVKWFIGSKGYGFITLEEKGMDFFFHVSDVIGTDIPKNKDRVAFKPVKTSKGLRAVQIEIVERNAAGDKIICPNCGRLAIPRLITYRGDPVKSICPFCGETIREF